MSCVTSCVGSVRSVRVDSPVTKDSEEAGSLSSSRFSRALGTNSSHALKKRTMFTWSSRAKIRTSRRIRRVSALTLLPEVSTTFFTA